MQHIHVTLIGVVVSDVFHTDNGAHEVASFRMVSRPRRFDNSTGQALAGEPSFVTVVARKALAANVAESIMRGDPVVVTGRLRVREREADGHTRIRVEVDAYTLGHDLGRGSTRFTRVPGRPRGEVGDSSSGAVEPGGSNAGWVEAERGERRTVA